MDFTLPSLKTKLLKALVTTNNPPSPPPPPPKKKSFYSLTICSANLHAIVVSEI